MIRKPFSQGWGMVTLAASIPVIFSFAAGISTEELSISGISKNVVFIPYDDMSHIFSYFSFGTMHIVLCVAATFYVYDIVRNSSSVFIFKEFKKNHLSAFVVVTVIFILLILLDTPLKRLSCDILWIGLDHLNSNKFLFKTAWKIDTPYASFGLRPFNIAPTSLVVAAFLPASAIMMAIPHLIEKINVAQNLTTEEIVSSFLNDFEVMYYLMVAMLVSSSLATHLYLRTPYAAIDGGASPQYANMISSVFSMWCIVYFLVLLGVLLVSYALVSSKIKQASARVDIFADTKRLANIRNSINIHFMIKRKSALFASSFSPIILLAVKNAFS